MQGNRIDHGPRLDKASLTKIGEGLQKQYAPLIAAPLPQRIGELASQLDHKLAFGDDVDPAHR
jgi:hypothetical protein